MNLVIGSDHAGFEHKAKLIKLLKESGHNIEDVGTDSSESCDYTDFGIKGAEFVSRRKADFGILICGAGIGMSITANKFKGVRAAVCWNEESAAITRVHNNSNIICIGARFFTVDECLKMIKVFLKTPASKEKRHIRRVNKIIALEERESICNGKT